MNEHFVLVRSILITALYIPLYSYLPRPGKTLYEPYFLVLCLAWCWGQLHLAACIFLLYTQSVRFSDYLTASLFWFGATAGALFLTRVQVLLSIIRRNLEGRNQAVVIYLGAITPPFLALCFSLVWTEALGKLSASMLFLVLAAGVTSARLFAVALRMTAKL
jgi:hypothetical protein